MSEETINNPWVSVEDRLPDPYKGVVAYFETYAADGTLSHDWCAAFMNARREWIAFGYNVQNAKIGAKVTHWMPIPEIPTTKQ